jgi:hypothetical protein
MIPFIVIPVTLTRTFAHCANGCADPGAGLDADELWHSILTTCVTLYIVRATR